MLDQITNENELMEDRDLVQFVNVKAKVIERDHVFYIGSFSEDLSFSEHATAHYPNGISITGRFEDHQPAGPCEIVFGAMGITETVLFSKGHRTGKATVTYPSGLAVEKTLTDFTPFLFQSVIPYGRNFYNHSVLAFPCGTPTVHAISRGAATFPAGGNLSWLLRYFDTQQSAMNVNLSATELLSLGDHLPRCIREHQRLRVVCAGSKGAEGEKNEKGMECEKNDGMECEKNDGMECEKKENGMQYEKNNGMGCEKENDGMECEKKENAMECEKNDELEYEKKENAMECETSPGSSGKDSPQLDPHERAAAPMTEEDFLASSDFYRVTSAMLCWDHVIARNRLNYSLPEIPSLHSINRTLVKSIARCRSPVSLTPKQKEVCRVVMDVLDYAQDFDDLTLVAWAEEALDLGGHTLFAKLQTLTLKSGRRADD